MVDGRELEEEAERNILKVPLLERIRLTSQEKEHILHNYTSFVLNTIKINFPEAFPDLECVEVDHQYKKLFENEVKVLTGPLIFETESTLEGISKVIKNLIDVVCPVVSDAAGKPAPVFPTTFSGDQKTEKSARSAQLALCDNGDMRDCLQFIEGRHECLHLLFMLSDVIKECFADQNNLEESISLSRLIAMLNPKLASRKGKDDFYKFRDLYQDIYVALLSEFVRSELGVDDLRHDVTPGHINKEKEPKKKEALFVEMFRNIIKNSHADFEDCGKLNEAEPLPPFYPQHDYLRPKYQNKPQSWKPTEVPEMSAPANVHKMVQVKFVDDNDVQLMGEVLRRAETVKPDAKHDYSSCLLSFIGQYLYLIDSQKNGNALDVFLVQKKLTKVIYSTGHKNYSSTLINFKQIILGHWSPQYSHRYMWNISAGRAGKGMKMARDQRQEHLNRYLKDSFKSVGVNLDEPNSTRINNSCDLSLKVERKIVEFHELDGSGKSHTKRDRRKQIDKLCNVFKQEKVAELIPGRKFNGPNVARSLDDLFDESSYRAWHYRKDKEMEKFSEFCKMNRPFSS